MDDVLFILRELLLVLNVRFEFMVLFVKFEVLK